MGFFDSVFGGPKDVMSPYIQEALKEVNKVGTPDIESMKIKLQQLVQQGVITPEQAQAALVQNNAYDNVTGNAEAQGAQMDALHGLTDIYNNGGMTDTTRSQIQNTLDTINNNQRGQDQAITEDAHRRGVSGSGLELAQRLMSQQNSANQAGRQGMDIAAMAEQAKREALMQAGQLGNQVEGQQFNEQSQKAAAQNAINQFNATNQQQVTLTNMAAKNAAQAQNLSEQQRVADANTTNENQNRERNSNLIQQDYNNRLNKAGTVAGLLGAQGRAAQSHEDSVAKRNMDLFSGAVGTAATFGAGMMGPAAATPNVASIGGGYTTLTGADRDKYKPMNMATGGKVPGAAPYPGDDTRNDVVDAKLSPGETVVPRSQSDEYEQFMNGMPRSENKPTADAVRLVLEALSGMGC